MRLAAALAVVLLLAGCGEQRARARIGGDAGGVPMTVSAVYDREALAAIAQGAGFTRTVVVERDAWPDPYWPHSRYHRHRLSGYHSHPWAGSGYAYEPATALSLLIGDGPAEAQLLRARLSPGTSSWTLPMRPGRVAVVSLQADGGREGWREIGRFTAATGMRVTVHLAGAQPRVEVEPASGYGTAASASPTTAKPSDAQLTPSSEPTDPDPRAQVQAAPNTAPAHPAEAATGSAPAVAPIQPTAPATPAPER